MAIFEETGEALVNPLVNLWNSFVNIIPGLIGALVVLTIGYLVGWVVGHVVKKILQKAKVDELIIEKTMLDKAIGKFQLSGFLGLLIKWYVFVLFLTPSAALVKLPALSAFLLSAALWIPNLIAAVLVALIGLIAADYVSLKVKETKIKSSGIVASVAKIVIIVFTLIIALGQISIDVSVAENSFLVILSGIMLALGLGFGLALKDELKPVVKKMVGKL